VDRDPVHVRIPWRIMISPVDVAESTAGQRVNLMTSAGQMGGELPAVQLGASRDF